MQWHEIACVGDLRHNNTKPTKTLDIPSIKGFRSLLLHGHGTHIATVPTAYRHADVSEVLSLRWSCPRMPAEAVVSRTMSHGLIVRFETSARSRAHASVPPCCVPLGFSMKHPWLGETPMKVPAKRLPFTTNGSLSCYE